MAYQIESIKETESKVDIILHYSKQKCKLLLLVKIFILNIVYVKIVLNTYLHIRENHCELCKVVQGK